MRTHFVLAAALAAALAACGGQEPGTPDSTGSREAGVRGGNGAPSGGHYTLNLIGVPAGNRPAEMNDNGSRIFVALEGRTKIMLSEGDFGVVDANGTDGSASFQLPSPGDGEDPAYTVWVRPLGQPGGSAHMTTCATYDDGTTTTEYCNTGFTVQVETGKGSKRFTDVSRDLLYVWVDLDGDGRTERYPLFDEALEDYLWQYDNYGLKLLQMRFYE
ncbi:hypothetical protein [Vulgatibacter sp.]|uniref:hypothetical protein n=1 Tax=Vulgatibacter sp. TaxID=1971226 RepID=UPI00356949BB